MKKSLLQAILTTIIIAGLSSLPVIAQHGLPRDPVLIGKILSVDAREKQVGLALNIHVANPKAPGKVPDELEQQAATLDAQAQQYEKQGNIAEAQRARNIAAELRRWREIEYNTVLNDRIPLIGLRRINLDEVPLGTRLRIVVSTPEPIQLNRIPTQLKMVRDAAQVANRAHSTIRELPRGERINYLEVVGEVVNLKPFTVKVDNNQVQIETPPEYGCLQQRVLQFNELQVGQRILTRVRMAGNNILELKRLIVFLDNKETLISPEDDLESE